MPTIFPYRLHYLASPGGPAGGVPGGDAQGAPRGPCWELAGVGVGLWVVLDVPGSMTILLKESREIFIDNSLKDLAFVLYCFYSGSSSNFVMTSYFTCLTCHWTRKTGFSCVKILTSWSMHVQVFKLTSWTSSAP